MTPGRNANPPGIAGGAGLAGKKKTNSWPVILSLVAIIAATTVAYSPVLFNFFNGDDFVHLTWLKDAVRNPELIWRNFHSSWLDGTTTRFYRPLISVFMVSDYLTWGVNGLGFRLTNLACHIGSSLLLYCIVKHMLSRSLDLKAYREHDNERLAAVTVPPAHTWALCAAALFALYPLHPEAVSWITGRVDSVVTTFYLATLWSYIKWRIAGRALWLAAAVSCFTLGLLSKEMAVTLPPLLIAYQLLFGTRTAAGGIAGMWSLLKPTVPFWLVLAIYFCVRRLALGTFVGGYDDSLFFIADWKSFILGWVHGLRMMVVPINKDLLGAHHPLTRLWTVTLAATAALGLWRIWRWPALIRPVAFAVIWLGAALVPVYKIFAIADDLQGSRLAYLATAPLCVLITVAFARPGRTSLGRPQEAASWILAVSLLALAAVLLGTNNKPWAQAGRESNAVRQALDKLYRELPGDPQVLMIGLPDNIEGAYTCRNALWGMTKRPQLHRDVYNCLMVNRFEPILPFGFLKESIRQAAGQVKIFRWAGEKGGFAAVRITGESPAGERLIWSGKKLYRVARPDTTRQTSAKWRADGALEVWGGSKRSLKARPQITLALGGLPCFDTDFIAVTVRLVPPEGSGGDVGADLLYSNDLCPDFALEQRTHAVIKPAPEEQTLIFALRGLPEWALGGTCRGFRLMLPDRCHLAIKSVEVIPTSEIMPRLDFADSGYLGTKGYIHISREHPEQTLSVDVSAIPGAKAAVLKITRPNLQFEVQNPQEEGAVVMSHLRCDTTSGTITLTRNMFPSTGIYEIRLWAVDRREQKIGVAGDHLVVSVDS